jgi:hypothetical protein
LEQHGSIASTMAALLRPQLEAIVGPLPPDAGVTKSLIEKILCAIGDDAAGIELWRGLPEDSGIALIAIFKGMAQLLTIKLRRNASALVSTIPHYRGGGRPPEKWPDDATCREIRRKIQSLHNSGLGIPKMEAYERVADEYGKSTRMVRRIYVSQKYASQK